MKRYILQLLVLASVSLSATSCVTTLYLDGQIPAATTVTADQWKVVVLNRYNPDVPAYNQERAVPVYRDGAHNAVTGAAEAVFNDPGFSLIEAGPQPAFISKTNTDFLTAEQIRSLYQKHPSHLFLAMDKLDAYIEREGTGTEQQSNNRNAPYYLIVKTNWSLYDSTGVLLDRATINKQTPFLTRSQINGIVAIGPSMTEVGEAVQLLAFDSGYDYWDRLYPQQYPMERKFYMNGPFQDAYMQLALGEYDQAIAQLLPLTENAKAKTATRAAYNLAVVYESAGNINEAYKWATTAAEKGEDKAKVMLSDWQAINKLIEQRQQNSTN